MKTTKSIAWLAVTTITLMVSALGAVPMFQEPAKQAAGELHFKAPVEWIVEKPSSNMRLAQYKLP
ncbi:MAG TPA: hypothetical protein VJS64_18085, partial [Pyrinomonadaceae bacterium]|nr:hypothetical protein [Pyrinomonadaceae bacterium]